MYEPQPLATVRHWRWELEDDTANEVLARSPWLESREECFAAYARIRTAFTHGQVEAVEIPGDESEQARGARPRGV